jgi:hypothetical protein
MYTTSLQVCASLMAPILLIVGPPPLLTPHLGALVAPERRRFVWWRRITRLICVMACMETQKHSRWSLRAIQQIDNCQLSQVEICQPMAGTT